jgi:hypothetical protein
VGAGQCDDTVGGGGSRRQPRLAVKVVPSRAQGGQQ